MSADDFLVPPVERNLMHMVVRQVRPRDEREKGKSSYGQSNSEHKEHKDEQKFQDVLDNHCVSEHKVDCKI